MPRGNRNGKSKLEKPKDFKGTFFRLLHELSAYKITIIIVLIFAILSTIFNIVGPKILGNATTVIYEGIVKMISGTGEIDFGAIGQIILTLIALYLISALFGYLQSALMVKVNNNFTYKIRKRIQSKINMLPLKYFDKRTYGEVLSYMTNDVDTITQNLGQGITEIITSVTTVIGILIMMFSISWQMTLVEILVLPVSIFLKYHFLLLQCNNR